jgi:asparagine synthase (glutamine-hydrolysing)
MWRGPLRISYHGEIYNFLELRDELTILGHRFFTRSDTEVLLAAYAQWGPDCLSRLNGAFAFAIWDDQKGVLFCARDRLGEKPFYYHAGPQCFIFASEIKSLLCFGPPVPREPHLPWLVEYFTKGYQPWEEQTSFVGILELPPAHYVVATITPSGGLQLGRCCYWDYPTREEQVESLSSARLGELLDDAVRLRLRSDVAVGTCLSGGIDSPAIAAAVVHAAATAPDLPFRYQAVHAFAPFPETDERPQVALLARCLGLEVNLVEVSGNGCREELDDLVYRQEMPVLGPSVYAQWCVFRRASELGLKVMLDGQGADELFGGYPWVVPRALAAIAQREGWWAAWREARATATSQHSCWRLLGQALLLHIRRRGGEFPDELAAALRAGMRRLSLPALLRYADRNSLAFGVEVRLPFLDPRLIEAAVGLAPRAYLAAGRTKAILREAVRDRLPPEILDRREKFAFAVPEARWLRQELASAVREAVADPCWKNLAFPGQKRLLQTALAEIGGARYNRAAWKVLCVYRWWRRFFGR